MEAAANLQRRTMRLYRVLVEQREDWGGALVLCSGAHCAASGVPVAASIAGAATLAIDADAEAMKSALRRGELDFVVNTLDEALRTLKNQVRQKRPLSVGLIADVAATLSELAIRGVQPDAIIDPALTPAAREAEMFFAARDASELKRLDGALLETLPASADARSRWIRRLPQYLREARSGGRWIWLSAEERAAVEARGFSSESH
jgi:Urocanase Rossmann-like domain